VIDRKDVGSWLQGPGAVRTDPKGYPGQRLGMPEEGPGSLARFGRRLVAVIIDWTICTVIGVAFFGAAWGRPAESLGHTFIVPAVFAVENILLVGTAGFTIGHRLLGIRVVRLRGASAGPLLALFRTLLLVLVIPALIWDLDTRGLHDKLAGTVLVRI
jgi:RDD family.